MDFGEVPKGSVKLLNLLAHEVENVGTRATARPLDLDDFLDLVEVEAESPGLSDESKGCQSLGPVDAIACRRPPRCGENPSLLVEPKRLSADPGA